MKIKKVNELNSNIKEEYIINKQEEIQKLKKLLQQVYEDGAENMNYDEIHGYEYSTTFKEYWEQYSDKLILDSGILDDKCDCLNPEWHEDDKGDYCYNCGKRKK